MLDKNKIAFVCLLAWIRYIKASLKESVVDDQWKWQLSTLLEYLFIINYLDLVVDYAVI